MLQPLEKSQTNIRVTSLGDGKRGRLELDGSRAQRSELLGKGGSTALLSCPSAQGLMAVGHPTQSHGAPPAPDPAMVLGCDAETMCNRFLPETHKHGRSWHAAANLIEETAKSTCSPALVPGGECWHRPALQRHILAPAGLPAPSGFAGSHTPASPCAPDTAHQLKEPRRALKRV